MADGRQVDLTTLIVIALLAIGVLVNVSIFQPGKLPRPTFRFSEFNVDQKQAQIQRQADLKRLRGYTLKKSDQELVKALRHYYDREFHYDYKRQRLKRIEARKQLLAKMRKYITIVGTARFVSLGVHVAERAVKTLDAFLAQVRKSRQTVYSSLRVQAGRPETAEMLKWNGAFIFLALRAGLISSHGVVKPANHVVIRILIKYQFLLLGAQVVPPQKYLTRFERLTYLRWKVEANRIARFRNRLRALNDLRLADKSYDFDLAAGVLYARARRYNAAARHFWRSFQRDPSNLQLIHYLDWLTDPANQ